MWKSDPHSRTATPQHRAWREAVLTRDGYQCQLQYPNRCTGTATEADHILEYSDRPDLAYNLDNGQAVCSACHKKKTADHALKKRWANRTHKHPGETHPGLR